MRLTVRAALAVALLAGVGCAAVIGLKDRTPSFCGDPSNQHSFCEDFDHPDALGDFTQVAEYGGGTIAVVESDAAVSPPNIAVMQTPPNDGDPGGQVLAGVSKEFDHPLTHLRIQVAFRFEQLDLPVPDGGAPGAAGLVLVQDKQGFSFAIGAGPNGTLAALLGAGASANADAASIQTMPLYVGLPMEHWLQLLVEIQRDDQGGASLLVTIVGQPGTNGAPPKIPAGSIAGIGTTLVGVAVQAIPPSGSLMVDYDNFTVDFLD